MRGTGKTNFANFRLEMQRIMHRHSAVLTNKGKRKQQCHFTLLSPVDVGQKRREHD